MGQILDLIKLFGLRRLLKMWRHHSEALPYVRGYCASICFWTLLHEGFFDELAQSGSIDLSEYAERKGLDLHVLESICEYLDGIKFLHIIDGRCHLDKRGLRFLDEPRGLFDLLSGYEPIFCELMALLKREKQYGRDVTRLGDRVALGSGELGCQLPFPVLRDLALKHGVKSVLDMGCGDCEFLLMLAEGGNIECYGFDYDPDAVRAAEKRIAEANRRGIVHVFQADMFDLETAREKWPKVDAFTAVDVFHEYLYGGNERILNFLKSLKALFPDTRLLVAEFCRQPHERLRKHPTAFLEHHLVHNLTMQVILSAEEWEDLFNRAGYRIADKRIFNLVGHGYFVLE